MKVVLYRRLSKKNTAENSHGLDVQEMDLQQYLANNPRCEVVGEFGEFYSGRGDFRKRQEFAKALSVCKELGATLVVNKPDRLARDVESGAHIINNYKVVFTNYPDADTLTKHILLTVAQAESDNTSSRVTAALEIAKSKGVKLGASAEKYKRNPNNATVINRKEAVQRTQCVSEQIKLITSVMPRATYKKVAEALTKNKVNLPSGVAGVWAASQVSRVCKRFEISLY